MEGRLSGENAEAFLRQSFFLADPDGQNVLNCGLIWDKAGDMEDFSSHLSFGPIAGGLL